MDDFKAIAKTLSERLVREGFIVQRYDAYSTASVYLKLDWGVCCSIRISDHPGKQHLRYRHNIGSWIKGYQSKLDNGCLRHFYPTSDMEKLVEIVLRERDGKIGQYGEDGYKRLISHSKYEASRRKSGFFAHCKMVGGAK